MSEIESVLENVKIPIFFNTNFNIPINEVVNVEQTVRDALQRKGTLSRLKKGAKVAVTAGSREIHNIVPILSTIIEEIKRVGAEPFIFPAMGSHGGATADGQRAVLAGYGITEESMKAPLISSMETIMVGKTDDGLPVHADKAALEADYIIPVGRVKPHPEFRGRHESGLLKMLAIGLGKQHGANMCHQMGMKKMPENILAFARVLLKSCSIPFGIGIVENGSHGTYLIKAVPSELMIDEDAQLLQTAKELTPVLPFEKVDVIICEEMGKDISGTGMDSNVIGRSISLGVSKPFAERVGIFSLTEKSHGNFNGIGLGDAVSRRLYDRISFSETYPNTITACETQAVKIPPVMENDKLCLLFCIKTCIGSDRNRTRIVWLKNTLSLRRFFISEALVDEAELNPMTEMESTPYSPVFNGDGIFDGFKSTIEKEGSYAVRK